MKKLFFKFCVLQAAYWSFYASLPGYITAYMLDRGMSASMLGIVLSLFMLMSFLGSIFWGRWMDRKQANRKYFLIGTASAAVLGTGLYFAGGSPMTLAVLYPVFGFMIGVLPTTLDSWVIASFPGQVDAGSRSRTFGTLGFAVTMLAAGQLITRIGYQVMPVMAAAFLAVAIAVALAQPEIPGVAPSDRETAVKGDPRQLLSSRKYLMLVCAVFFTGMAIAPINNMKVLVFESVGGDVSFLGWDSFIGCMIQAPFLIFSGKLGKYKAEYRLTLGAFCALLYAAMVLVARSPAMVIMGTILNNISFGVMFPTMREMTEMSVSPALRTTAHSVIDVAYGSVAGMIASAWSGTLLQHAGVSAMGGICAAIQIVAIIFCSAIILTGRRPARKVGHS